MPRSQHSDSQYLASQYAESFIDPDILQSDDFLDFPSQAGRTTTSFSDYSLPPIRHRDTVRAPESLRRVGKHLQKHWILFNDNLTDPDMESSRNSFVEWWLKTEFGEKEDLQKSIQWQSKQKTSDVWGCFDQVAHEKTGEPKVMCRRCQAVLVHPSHRRAGTSPMKIHMKSIICAKPSGSKKQGIDQLLQNMVCLSLRARPSKLGSFTYTSYIFSRIRRYLPHSISLPFNKRFLNL